MIVENRVRRVLCPVCTRGRLCDAKDVGISTVRIHSLPRSAGATLVVKCPKCKTSIGISIKSE